MKLRPEEITSILKERIENFDTESNLAEVGAVLQVGDGIARIHGLENCLALEMLELEHGVVGLAFNLEEDNVGAALFGDWDKITEGEPVRRTSGRSHRCRSGKRCSATSSTHSGTRSTGSAPLKRPRRAPSSGGARRHPAPIGQAAAPHRHQGD